MKRPHHKAKPKRENPISAAIKTWFPTVVEDLTSSSISISDSLEALFDEAPKRWVIYKPMVLLPSGSFDGPIWSQILGLATAEQTCMLWLQVLCQLSNTTKESLTHLAVNAAIPLHREDSTDEENVLRSPTRLKILHGDFGPASTSQPPGTEDLAAAFWASATQNGIHQTWAPRWTMFSRGNVKEKMRLLAFHDGGGGGGGGGSEALPHRAWPQSRLKDRWAVDLYAGIGYFVFSYAALGMRVLCWELNPWSVEGLRRGAERNGWPVKVVEKEELEKSTLELVDGDERIIVFLEDNREAARRFDELRAGGRTLDVIHVNCGFLPSSQLSWKSAWEIAQPGQDAWLHLHENVGVKDIEERRKSIQSVFSAWNDATKEPGSVMIDHVELVKTFAPGVWHCVFDVYITSSNS